MKRILFFVACTFGFVTLYAQNKETVEGNGKLVTVDIPVQTFSELKASGVYELQLMQGSKETVKIEADENLQELFTISNEGNKLVVTTKKLNNKNLKTKNKMKVLITFKKLNNLEINTVGGVHSEGQLAFDDVEVRNNSVGNVTLKMTANKLNLVNKSVGNIDLIGTAQTAVVRNEAVGNITADRFVVQDMDIENSGIGSASVNAEKQLKVKDSFLGKVKNKGAATPRKMNKVVI
jgi:hypothetical protein